MRGGLAAAAGLLLASCVPPAGRPDTMAAGDDWPIYHGTAGGTHYSTLDQINTGNVRHLKVAWVYDTGDGFGTDNDQSDMQMNPLIVHGRMFVVSPKGRVICLDAAHGREIWAYDPSDAPVTTRQRLRGVSYWTDYDSERILFSFGHDLISLDAVTGHRDPGFGKDGRIDLRVGLGRDPATLTVNEVSPGIVWRDLIILGSTGQTPGDVRAFDVRTGAQRWSFHTIPHPGEAGYETWPRDAWQREFGANVWTGLTVDAERGIVFLPTASPGMTQRDFYGAARPGANRMGDSLIALDAKSGRRLWDFQSVHHDLWDRDFPAPPTLITVRRGARDIPAVAAPTKSGWVYIFDRVTGRPLYPIAEKRVPPSDVPGEQAWPTQPLPLAPPPFARQRLTEDMLTDRTSAAHAAVLAAFRGKRSAGQWVPPSLQGSIIFPGLDGAAEWGGAAFDPETGLLYINSNEMAWTLKLNPRPRQVAGTGAAALYQNVCAACHGADRKGSPPTIPALIDAARLGEAAIVRQISAGGGRMPGFGGTLTPERIKAMAAYLVSGQDQGVAGGNETAVATPDPFHEPYVFDGYKRFLDPDGYPAVKPPWGTLNALDVNRGRYAWRIPFGSFPELAAKGHGDTGSENYGGAVVTKGGLLFIGATIYDDLFHAFDKRTGRLLWSIRLPAAGVASPATYAVNGRQYVVIGAGGGKNPKHAPGGKIVAFTLGK